MVPSLGPSAAMVILGMALPEVHQQHVGCDPVTQIADETITKAALAAQSHVQHAITRWAVAGGDDAMVAALARSGLIFDIVQAAAPIIAATERERIRKRAEVVGATFLAARDGTQYEVPFAAVIDPAVQITNPPTRTEGNPPS